MSAKMSVHGAGMDLPVPSLLTAPLMVAPSAEAAWGNIAFFGETVKRILSVL